MIGVLITALLFLIHKLMSAKRLSEATQKVGANLKFKYRPEDRSAGVVGGVTIPLLKARNSRCWCTFR
jgi:hypothetical protein